MSPATLEWEEETTAFAEPSGARWVPQAYYDPGFKASVIGRVRELANLQPGWDGYEAPSPSPALIEAIVGLVVSWPEHLAPRPHVSPLGSGGIQLEWVSGSRVLELEFESPERLHYLRWHPDSDVADEAVISTNDHAQTEALIRWFVTKNA
jgi:hypothetical protein